MKVPVPKVASKLTKSEKTNLGNSPASDGVLGKAINPGVKKIGKL